MATVTVIAAMVFSACNSDKRIGGVCFEGDSAGVDFTQETPIKSIEGTISVVKEEGKWIVDLPLGQ